jgi:hypothetical protein
MPARNACQLRADVLVSSVIIIGGIYLRAPELRLGYIYIVLFDISSDPSVACAR